MWDSIVQFFQSVVEWMYSFTGSYAISFMLFGVLVRVITLPLDLKSKSSMAKIQELQPKIDRINKKYAGDKEKASRKTMELYKKYNVNPLSGCFPVLLQFPLIIVMFSAIRKISEAKVLEFASESFLWIKNIWWPDTPFYQMGGVKIPLMNLFTDTAHTLSIANGLLILPILIFFISIFYNRFTQPQQKKPAAKSGEENPMGDVSKYMKYLMPVMMVYFTIISSAAFSLYYISSFSLQIIIYAIQTRILNKQKEQRKEERRIAREEKLRREGQQVAPVGSVAGKRPAIAKAKSDDEGDF